jgi:hypothetical protein
MNPLALEKAQFRLQKAEEAYQRLCEGTSMEDFRSDWTDFLLASNAVYSCLEQGAKRKPQSQQWFGQLKNERRKDPLLQYIHQARNADEHGLAAVFEPSDDGFVEVGGPGVTVYGATIIEDGNTVFNEKWPEGLTGGKVFNNRRPELVRVRDDRFGDEFDPPESHLGNPINGRNPVLVARAALDYQRKILEIAEHYVNLD